MAIASHLSPKRALTPTLLPLTRTLATGGAVIAYHGVAPADAGALSGAMHVPFERLAATVRSLRRVATLAPLHEVVARHRQGRSTKGLVAITFDDAYASIAAEALAFLVAEAIPATLFVVVERARTGAAFWWDRLDEVMARASPAQWRAFEEACGLPTAFRAGQPSHMGPLRPLRQWILAEHFGRWPDSLERPLASVERELGCRTAQRPLTFDELDRVVASPLVDIGAHTLTHPVLPLLADDELRREVRGSFDELRSRYPATVPVLAPPFGLYDERTLRIVEEEGFTGCLSLAGTQLDDRAPAGLIPRFGMTPRHQPWKVVLYALGCWYRVRPRRDANHRYPELPSAAT